jgi:hypothetical protein
MPLQCTWASEMAVQTSQTFPDLSLSLSVMSDFISISVTNSVAYYEINVIADTENYFHTSLSSCYPFITNCPTLQK